MKVTEKSRLSAAASASGEKPIDRVPLLDLVVQYQSLKDALHEALDRVVESQHFILGPEVDALEKEVAKYCGSRCAVGVSSGTDALIVSLMALGIGPGDEVITTPFTFFSTVGSIVRLGAKPVFVDIEPETFNIDASLAARAVNSRTRAIIPVHLFGQCAEMDPIMEVAGRHNIAVIEDAAQAIGAEYKGRLAGSMGTAGCFSFFPSKNLGGFGDGGMVTTNDEDLADRIKILRNHGAQPKYYHEVVGGNFRLDAIQAAVLRVKLLHLDSWSAARRSNAEFYSTALTDLGLAERLVVPPVVKYERHIFNQYVIRAENRDGLRKFLQDSEISTEIYYPVPLHLQACMRDPKWAEGAFPVSEQASRSVLALPIYPELTHSQKTYVISKIKEFYDGQG